MLVKLKMKIKKNIPLIDQHDKFGFWGGKFGGNFIPETLKKPVEDLEILFKKLRKDKKFIKEKYNKKIISALTIQNKKDVEKYKEYELISDIILFDGKGYEKSIGFDHLLVKNLPSIIKKMLAGNIKYNEKLDKYSKITDIIDISGSLETSGKKDISKINVLLKKINKIKNEN